MLIYKRKHQFTLCSSAFLPLFFFSDFQTSKFSCPVFVPGLSLLDCKVFSSLKANSCFSQSLLSGNLTLVYLISIGISLRIGWNFFHTHIIEDIKWIYLKGSTFCKVSVIHITLMKVHHFFYSYYKAPISRSHSSTMQSSAWHSKFNTHIPFFFLFLFWWERLSYSFSPTSMSEKFPLERRGFYCSVKFIKLNLKALDVIWFCS